MLLDQLPRRKISLNYIWQRRHTFRRLGQMLTQQGLVDPISPKNGARPRGT